MQLPSELQLILKVNGELWINEYMDCYSDNGDCETIPIWLHSNFIPIKEIKSKKEEYIPETMDSMFVFYNRHKQIWTFKVWSPKTLH